MATRIVAPEGASEPAKGTTNRAGFSVDQLDSVLEVIAGRMNTLHQLIMVANGGSSYDDFVKDICCDAAEALATYIGAMADEASGADVVGDLEYWSYGPSFGRSAKEVSHG